MLYYSLLKVLIYLFLSRNKSVTFSLMLYHQLFYFFRIQFIESVTISFNHSFRYIIISFIYIYLKTYISLFSLDIDSVLSFLISSSLQLSYNQLSSLPSEIGQLTNLTTLYVCFRIHFFVFRLHGNISTISIRLLLYLYCYIIICSPLYYSVIYYIVLFDV